MVGVRVICTNSSLYKEEMLMKALKMKAPVKYTKSFSADNFQGIKRR